MFTVIAAMLMVSQVGQVVDPRMAERFESLEWRSPEASGSHLYRYRLFVPDGANQNLANPLYESAGKRWPLLVWLHGFGERGADNTFHLKWLQLIFDATNDSPPMFILAVQYPSHHADWTSSRTTSEEDGLSITDHILDEVLTKHSVDRNRIYLSGVSAGGSACWEYACRHPTRFAAIAPLASSGGDASRAADLRNIPIWAFHSSNDRETTPDRVRSMVEAVQQSGGEAHLTETPPNLRYAHDCWTAALQNYDLVDWMLAQRRGAAISWWPPGLRRWAWWQLPAWSGVFALVVTTLICEKRRRHRLRSRDSNQVGASNDQTTLSAVNSAA